MAQKKKKRKKKSGIQPQKVKQAQHKNQFLKKLYHVLSLLGCGDLYHQISREEKESFYLLHFRSIRVEAHKNQNISHRLVKFFNWFVNHYIKREINKIELYQDGPKISFYDYLNILYTFYVYDELIESERFDTIKEVRRRLREILDFKEILGQANKILDTVLIFGALYRSNIMSAFYWFNLDVRLLDDEDQSFIRLNLHREPVEVRSIKFNGIYRKVYKLAFPLGNAIKKLTIDARTMKMHPENPDKVWDLYIQGHALQRLYERLDHEDSYEVQMDLLFSLRKPRVHIMDHKKRMIEYRIMDDKKVGYLVSEVVDDIVVIRTFLLLTNSHTPEGEKLKEILNTTKTDMKYWAIDRMSTFIASDINKNEALKSKFIEAGCGDLFDINYSSRELMGQNIEQADAMVKYFGLDDEEEGTMVRRHDSTKERLNDGTMAREQ